MTWQDLSVYQFQLIAKLDLSDPSPDTVVKLVAACFNITEHEVDSWPVSKFQAKTKELDFLNQPPIWEPKDYVEIEGRRYRFVYDVRNIHAARYIDAKTFGKGGFIPSLHMAAASMVVPQEKKGKHWVDVEYDASKHGDYAQDMLAAPITAIHGSALFFSKVYRHSMLALAASLESETMTPTQMAEARALLAASSMYMDGSTTPPLSQSTSVSHLSRRIASRQFNSSMTWPTSKRKLRTRKSYVKTESEHT